MIVEPGKRFIRGLAVFDRASSTAASTGTAAAFGGVSGRLRLAQNGFVRSYALAVLGGAALVLARARWR